MRNLITVTIIPFSISIMFLLQLSRRTCHATCSDGDDVAYGRGDRGGDDGQTFGIQDD